MKKKRASRATLPSRYTKALENLFHKLVIKEAIGTATAIEKAQIEYLNVLRTWK